MVEVPRRNAARGVLRSVPVLAVAASAPAQAVSCTPRTEVKTVNLHWVSTLVSFEAGEGESDVRTIRYTFTNEGPDDVPTQVKFDLRYVVTVDSADWSASVVTEAVSTSAAASLVESASSTDPDRVR